MLDNKKNILVGLSFVLTAAFVLWAYSDWVGHDHDHGDHSEAHNEGGHGHSGEENHKEGKNSVHLSQLEIDEFSIKVEEVEPKKLQIHLDLSGEVSFNADKVAHIVPRVPGIVLEVRKAIGDTVAVGDVLAVLESRELANAKARYLASRKRRELRESNLDREKNLWEKKVSSEQEYLNAKVAFAEAEIEEHVAEQELHALGISHERIRSLVSQHDQRLTRYELTAPISGVVTEKHITIGEKIRGENQPFVIADTSQVWVDFTLYQKDLSSIKKGQDVVISPFENDVYATGRVEWISPYLDESTRTATARVVIDNGKGLFFPGMFVSGKVVIDHVTVDLGIKKTGIQFIDEEKVVFVQNGEEFAPHPIQLGREDHEHIEVLSGLLPGQQYVYRNSFTLKSELEKDSFGSGHAH